MIPMSVVPGADRLSSPRRFSAPCGSVTAAEALRARARRILNYAYNFSDDKVVDRLQRYAAELEKRAEDLEQHDGSFET
jgi:hypothetical protein